MTDARSTVGVGRRQVAAAAALARTGWPHVEVAAALGADGTWHDPGCAAGRELVVAPLWSHPLAGATGPGAGCCWAVRVTGDRAALGGLEALAAAAAGHERVFAELAAVAALRAGSSARHAATARAEEHIRDLAGAAPLEAAATVRAWAAGWRRRLDVPAAQRRRELLADVLVAVEDRLYQPDGVAPWVWEVWRRARLAGLGRGELGAALAAAVAGGVPLDDLHGASLAGPATAPWTARVAPRRYARRWAARLDDGLYRRVDALVDDGATALVAVPRGRPGPLPASLVDVFGAGDGVLVVPAAAAWKVARATSGRCLGPGGPLAAEVFARLAPQVGDDRAYRAAAAALA